MFVTLYRQKRCSEAMTLAVARKKRRLFVRLSDGMLAVLSLPSGETMAMTHMMLRYMYTQTVLMTIRSHNCTPAAKQLL